MSNNNCKYVPKKEFKNYKQTMEETNIKVRADLKEKYGKSCNSMLVGSAKRNLVVKKGDSLYDVDYQFLFTSPVYDDEDKIKPYDLKEFVRNKFEEHLGKKYSVKMSKSVITISLKDDEGQHAIKSFDVALIRKKDNKILRGKSNDSDSDDRVRWESLPKKTSKYYERRKEICGQEMWDDFRDIFKDKKCENMAKEKDDQKPTFSLYLETIKETLDKHQK